MKKSVIAFCIALVIALWLGLAALLQYERASIIQNAMQETHNLARVFEEHVLRTIRTADSNLLRMISEYHRRGEKLDLARYVQEQGISSEPYNALSIIDQNGDLLFLSKPFSTPQNFKDNDNYQHHVQRKTQDLFISAPRLGAITGRLSIYLSRRIDKADGSFGGVATVAIDSTHLSDFYNQIDLGQDGVVVLVGRDGIVRARQSNVESSAGQNIGGGETFHKLAASDRGSHRITQTLDGIARIASYSALKDYPLVVIVGKSEATVLAAYYARRMVYAGFTGVMSVLILGFAALVTFQISRQSRAGDNLRASERRLHEIIEMMPVGLFIKDPASRIVLMNRACEVQWGMAFADLRDTDGSRFFPPGQMEGFLAADRDAFAGQRSLDFEEVSWNAALKENRNVRTLKKPVFGANGDPAYLIGMTIDITEHKNAEAALRRSEARLKEAQALVHIGSWELDLMSNVLHWCDEIYRIFEIDPRRFGATYEAFLGAVHPDDRARVDQAYTNSVASKIPYSIEHRLLMADGRIKWVWEQCSTYYDSGGKPLRSIGTVQDVTERAVEQKALQKSQSLLANIIGSAMDAIITVDETYRILVFNRAAEAMFRCKAADAIGQHLDRFIPERFRARHHALMREFGATGATTRAMGQPGTVIGLRADGGEFPVEATIARAKADDRQLFTVMLRDIVGRIAAAESQRDALVREVHHRIKNNLQGVIGLMRQHLTAHPEAEDLVERMVGQIRAIAVIHGMHSELTQGEIGLCELVTDISQATTVLTQIEIAADGLADMPGSIRIPRDEAVPIALVLNELLFNATKHGLSGTGGGGIRVRVSGHDRLARVRISNPGALPAPDFDFAKGTGLGTGLNLVKALLPRHGARLEIIQADDQVVVELTLTDPAIICSS